MNDPKNRSRYNVASVVRRGTIHHTFVPVELRGRNFAGHLAKAAFDHARTEGFKIIPRCSYIARYAERFPEAGARILRA